MRGIKRMQRQILKGPIVKTMLALGLPLMLTHMFQMFYALADMFWLGNYVGTIGVAATTLAWPLVFFLMSLAMGMSVAGTAMVSQYTGRKDKVQVKKSAGQVMALLAIMAVILATIGILVTDLLLGFMGAQPEVMSESSIYIKIIFASAPFMFIMMTFASILRGWGDTWTPMIISGLSVGLNMVLDPLLIAGFFGFPAMGVQGAAIATIISRSIGAVACIYLLFRGRRNLRLSLHHFKFEAEKVKQIFKIGIPASLGQSLVAFGFIVMMSFVAHFDTTALATYGIGTRVINMVFIVTGGVTGAAVTMIGQNLGANRIDRAQRILTRAIMLTILFLVTCSTFFYIFNEQLFGLFLSDRDVIAEGRMFMLAFGFSIMGFGIYSSIQAAYQASGRTIPSMIMGMIRLWGLRVPLSFLFAFTLGWGLTGLWIGMGLSNYLSALVALVWVSTGSWKSSVLERKPPLIRETRI